MICCDSLINSDSVSRYCSSHPFKSLGSGAFHVEGSTVILPNSSCASFDMVVGICTRYVTFCIPVEFPILVEAFALELLSLCNASANETMDSFNLGDKDVRSKLGADKLDAVIRFSGNVVMLSDGIVLLDDFGEAINSWCCCAITVFVNDTNNNENIIIIALKTNIFILFQVNMFNN